MAKSDKWIAVHKTQEYRAKCSAAQKRRYAKETSERKAARTKAITAAKKGKPNGLTGRKWSAERRRKHSEWAKTRGETHNWYIDGKGRDRDTERHFAMARIDYRLWRETVFERDDFTCQSCGQRGGYLIADHIQPWKTHPLLRYSVENGRTLCKECHLSTPTFGSRINLDLT
jgi:5-methylcytosine-specific restriction endonuclease McrA